MYFQYKKTSLLSKTKTCWFQDVVYLELALYVHVRQLFCQDHHVHIIRLSELYNQISVVGVSVWAS